ncbi:MAG: aryl-sulfate sulfotransferase [Alphaproteobacteria bacterium]|nr:aryl-sulfate sulfotransferase [Alphaproteobacteria bacterium]
MSDATRLDRRSVTISGHRTSVSLEQAFWWALRAIAERRGLSLNRLIAEIDSGRTAGSLSSALRVFVLGHAAGTSGKPTG